MDDGLQAFGGGGGGVALNANPFLIKIGSV